MADFSGAAHQTPERLATETEEVSRYFNLGFHLNQRTTCLPEELPELALRLNSRVTRALGETRKQQLETCL